MHKQINECDYILMCMLFYSSLASTLCMAWHAQQICSLGHSASTTSVAAGGVAMRSNTNKAKQPKRDKVFLNTTHSWGVWPQSASAQQKYVGVVARGRALCACVFARARAYACMCICAGACVHVPACMCLRACAWRVCLRMHGCAGVLHVCMHIHACSCAGACVRAWSGPRVSECMRVCARAIVRVVCMRMRILAQMRMRACVCASAFMSEYTCICICACTDLCMYMEMRLWVCGYICTNI